MGLQRGLPGARVVYCSATGASEPRNLGYMERLGLWGPGIPSFTNFQVCLGLWPASMMAWLGVNLRPFCLCHSLDAVRQELRYLSEVDIPVSSLQACLRLRIYSELSVRWTQKKCLEDQAGTKTAMFCRSIPVHCLFATDSFSGFCNQQSLPCWQLYRLLALFMADTAAIKHSMMLHVSF